jgi:hypothetical protein
MELITHSSEIVYMLNIIARHVNFGTVKDNTLKYYHFKNKGSD